MHDEELWGCVRADLSPGLGQKAAQASGPQGFVRSVRDNTGVAINIPSNREDGEQRE